jgi:iron-sulfur cluster assembly protein
MEPNKNKQPITITPAAIEHIRQLLAKRGKPCMGIRIGVKTRGCSGQAYTLEYADTAQPLEESMDFGDFKLLIDPKALLFVLGTEMDFQQEKLQSGFVFRNPNEKGRCGCGESFHV